MLVSRLLRGGSMPVDMVVYTTLLTLVVFLFFKLPPIWHGVNYEKPPGGEKISRNAVAIVLACIGALTLTIQFLMAPTHTIGGINYADVWHATLSLLGAGLLLAGAIAGVAKPSPNPRLPALKLRN